MTDREDDTYAIVTGPDNADVSPALEAEGVEVRRLQGIVSRPQLEDAGIVDADLYVLTDVDQATTIPIVCDLNDDLQTVVYADRTTPEFVKAQLDLAVDPQLIGPDVLAEELLG
ncbi:DUF7126 family protein [Natronobacterium gregoryi]|uniref:CTP synthetase n=2 Tax=Natronobacterium gregoryi TaxID=44930 RepID=L0AGF5_NATGS|nr:hypothetical protein [Natronobacterium gregoryi]AFZ72237.1 hypothetical protein Natgr_1006 [Natronobacterium gregoryi SP2]ELY62363.1 CTP synthetase [Natronobacterium gregoryi SP2]PLK20184.1 CTP synthetase [Natronobacterium gregoryi SP2]SFJ28681.1 hypothetical protein SAMN05443661_12035 [Natronobacterium gregoryi]